LHWSLVEQVVLAAPEQKRELLDVQRALSIMEDELLNIISYLKDTPDNEIDM